MQRTGSSDYTPDEVAELAVLRDEIVALQAQDSARQAREAVILHRVSQIASVASSRGEASSRASELPFRAVAADFAAALRISDRTVQRMLGAGDTLVNGFPGTLAALAEGRIHRGHIPGIVDAGAHLPSPQARSVFEAEVLPVAAREAPGRVRPFARRVAERVHPRSFTERHDAAAACRGLRVNDLPDGMSELIATLPSVVAHGVLDRVKQMARQVKDARHDATRRGRAGAGAGAGAGAATPTTGSAFIEGDERSIDEVRADIFADLLLTGDPAGHAGSHSEPGGVGDVAGATLLAGLGAITAHVQVTVPVLSLIGVTETPATLAGVGPIDADTARRIAGASSGWDRILTDPITGSVLAVDRYTPSVQLKRTLQVRDQHCRFPGCRQPVHRSDIDHTIDYAHGGQTRENNLAHLCRGHHTLKHQTTWRVIQKPGGTLEWTSPTGQVYPDVPTSTVMFRPENDWDDWNEHFAAAADAAGGTHVAAAITTTDGAVAVAVAVEEPAPF